MGQHLHLYAIEPGAENSVKAWCDCRAWEHSRVPAPGFEEAAQRRIQGIMDRYRKTESAHHLECGSTWCVQVWGRFIWEPMAVTPDLIQLARVDVDDALQKLPAMPRDGWRTHPIFEFLNAHVGWTVWGDNDGI